MTCNPGRYTSESYWRTEKRVMINPGWGHVWEEESDVCLCGKIAWHGTPERKPTGNSGVKRVENSSDASRNSMPE